MNMTSDVNSGTSANALKPPPLTYRTPLGARMASLFGTVVLGLTTAIIAALVGLVIVRQAALGLFMLAIAGFLAGLTGYVWRDLSGKWGLRLVLDAEAVTLDLPAGQSLIHRPPKQHLTIPYGDIASVETRLEAYGTFGMEMMLRPYVLCRKNNDLVFLFEDRALATAMASGLFADIASELALRAEVKLHDLGMVEGKGGFLCVWGTRAPDWAAPSLPLARQLRLWRHSALTGALALSIIFLALVLRMIVGF